MSDTRKTSDGATLRRIENILLSMLESIKRFESFVLEVSPDEAKEHISELEAEL